MKSKRPEIKEIGIISAFILFSITVVVTALLATVNQFTEPVISQHEIEEAEISHAHVFKTAASFTDRSDEFISSEDTRIVTVFDALDDNGEVIGVVLETLAKGYGGDVKVMTAVSPDFEIIGLAVLTNSETPGLGTKITAQGFTDKFIGRDPGIKFTLKPEESELNHIDGLTGATLSSKAVINAANLALDFAGEIMEDIMAGGGAND